MPVQDKWKKKQKKETGRSHHSFWRLFFKQHGCQMIIKEFVAGLVWPEAMVQAWIIVMVFVQNN